MGRQVIESGFSGGGLGREGGALLLRCMDVRLGLSAGAARALVDDRQRVEIWHDVTSVGSQRTSGLCPDWADVSDHSALRSHLVQQMADGPDQALASTPTLTRPETAATSAQAWAVFRKAGMRAALTKLAFRRWRRTGKPHSVSLPVLPICRCWTRSALQDPA